MHESGMSELGNQQSYKEVDWQKLLENIKILRLNVFKYKIHLIFFSGIKMQNSILYFKYMYLKYCPSLPIRPSFIFS